MFGPCLHNNDTKDALNEAAFIGVTVSRVRRGVPFSTQPVAATSTRDALDANMFSLESVPRGR